MWFLRSGRELFVIREYRFVNKKVQVVFWSECFDHKWNILYFGPTNIIQDYFRYLYKINYAPITCSYLVIDNTQTTLQCLWMNSFCFSENCVSSVYCFKLQTAKTDIVIRKKDFKEPTRWDVWELFQKHLSCFLSHYTHQPSDFSNLLYFLLE